MSSLVGSRVIDQHGYFMAETRAPAKWLWTEADFEIMGWHDARIHAVAFLEETFEFALDIDYIFEWVKPVPPAEHFTFWLSPCTLVFENVSELAIDLAPYDDLSIDDISRGESLIPRNAEVIGKTVEWLWNVGCHGGTISMRAAGYKQHVRTAPRHLTRQSIPISDRGGISFSQGKDR